EVTQRARGNAKLLDACDRLGLHAGRIEAERSRVGDGVHRCRQRRDIRQIVVSWVLPVEQIEKLHEWLHSHPFPDCETPRYPHVHLIERPPSKLIQFRLHAVHYRAVLPYSVSIHVEGCHHGERPRTFKLRNRGSLDLAWEFGHADEHKPMTDILP